MLYLSSFLIYFHRYSIPLLNERLISCFCPFRCVFFLWFPQENARWLARSPVPSFHRISISVFHSIASSHLHSPDTASPFFLVVCRGFTSPLPHLSSPLLSHPLSRFVHERKNGEKRSWLGMESLTTHLSTWLIPLFSRESSVAPRNESPLAHSTRSECGWKASGSSFNE